MLVLLAVMAAVSVPTPAGAQEVDIEFVERINNPADNTSTWVYRWTWDGEGEEPGPAVVERLAVDECELTSMSPTDGLLGSGSGDDPWYGRPYEFAALVWNDLSLVEDGEDVGGVYQLDLRYTVKGFLWPERSARAAWGPDPTNDVSSVTIPGCYAAFVVRKLDDRGNPVQGATFTLTPVDKGDPTIVTATATTDANGYAVFEPEDLFSDEIGDGDYEFLLEETEAPAGYRLDAIQRLVNLHVVIGVIRNFFEFFAWPGPEPIVGREPTLVSVASPLEVVNQRASTPARAARTPRADLAVTKDVDEPAPQEGQQVTFTVTVTNEGPDDARDVVVTDVMPPGLSYGSHEASQGDFDPAAGRWDVGDLDDDASASLTITALVEPGTAGQRLISRARVEASSPSDRNADNNTASAEVMVVAPPEPEPEPEPELEAPPLPVTGGNATVYLIAGVVALVAGFGVRKRFQSGS